MAEREKLASASNALGGGGAKKRNGVLKDNALKLHNYTPLTSRCVRAMEAAQQWDWGLVMIITNPEVIVRKACILTRHMVPPRWVYNEASSTEKAAALI